MKSHILIGLAAVVLVLLFGIVFLGVRILSQMSPPLLPEQSEERAVPITQTPTISHTQQKDSPPHTPTPGYTSTNTLPTSAQRLTFSLGEQEVVSYTSDFINVPDGHISYIRQGEELRVWFPINVTSYLFVGPNFDSLQPHALDADGYASPVLWPGEDTFENGYAAFGSVVRGRQEKELLGFYHTETWKDFETRFSFTGSVAHATSYDGGVTWQRKGQVVTGKNASPPGERISGAGQPSVIQVGEYLYMYYIDWNGQDPDAIHLARAPFASGGAPGSWEKWTTQGFGPSGMGGYSDPVILPPRDGAEGEFAGIPSVSYNTYLGQYLCIFEANSGFYATTSVDGIFWSTPQLVMEFPISQSDKQPGDTWYSYPSLITHKEQDHTHTGQRAFLYYSEGKWQEILHYMVRREIEINKQ